MELSIKLSSLILSILFTGLTAGLCFTWSNAVTPGIGRLDDLTFLQAFQAMNRAIINPAFIAVFFGPIIGLILTVYFYRNDNSPSFWMFLSAALLFFVGVTLVTIFKNVPLNELLDKADLKSSSKWQLEQLRHTFEKPWNQWHLVRTITSVISFLLLLIGLLLK